MSLLAHPGLSHTNLQVHTVELGAAGFAGGMFKTLAAKTGMPADKGALPQLRAALDPRAKSGEFSVPRFATTGAPVKRPLLRLRNDGNIEKLWLLSEMETGLSIKL